MHFRLFKINWNRLSIVISEKAEVFHIVFRLAVCCLVWRKWIRQIDGFWIYLIRIIMFIIIIRLWFGWQQHHFFPFTFVYKGCVDGCFADRHTCVCKNVFRFQKQRWTGDCLIWSECDALFSSNNHVNNFSRALVDGIKLFNVDIIGISIYWILNTVRLRAILRETDSEWTRVSDQSTNFRCCYSISWCKPRYINSIAKQ